MIRIVICILVLASINLFAQWNANEWLSTRKNPVQKVLKNKKNKAWVLVYNNVKLENPIDFKKISKNKIIDNYKLEMKRTLSSKGFSDIEVRKMDIKYKPLKNLYVMKIEGDYFNPIKERIFYSELRYIVGVEADVYMSRSNIKQDIIRFNKDINKIKRGILK